ncbi:MAG TPA: helix-hairpin-helix domain-containing protein [Patescibacteria group bacterium]|nr:helix-hairpin-helix domain-containing protein [Patescibacteria group bacterium]
MDFRSHIDKIRHFLGTASPLFYTSVGFGILGIGSVCLGIFFLLRTSNISAKDDHSPDSAIFIQQKDSSGEVASVSASVFVYVSGGVKKPDVYKLEKDNLIRDAIAAAGGFSRNANSARVAKELNLADVIHPALHIHVPILSEENATGKENEKKTTQDYTLVAVNSASLTRLQELPGIGEERAKKIVASRPYGSLDELKQKTQLSATIIDPLADLITFSTD